MSKTAVSIFDSDSDSEGDNDHGQCSTNSTPNITIKRKDLKDHGQLKKNKQDNFDADFGDDEDPNEMCLETSGNVKLEDVSAAQRARMERNRQRALLIRREMQNKRLQADEKPEKPAIIVNDTKLTDSGGGFFIEEDPSQEGKNKEMTDQEMIAMLRSTAPAPPLPPSMRPLCEECGFCFDSSTLRDKFGHDVCDDCKKSDSTHALITRTDAKKEYLLQDCDLDLRKPKLRHVLRKNPHNPRWGDMKLYLKLQVEKRCLEVWGTEEALEEAIEKKGEDRKVAQHKKFKKKMQDLRMNVRSSLYTRATKSHVHEWGEEEETEDDEFRKTCRTCDYSYTYDKM